jgi:uncharacterized protein YceH (UPF0502 family)
VKQIPPSPGSRAERYLQLLSPDLHDVGEVSADSTSVSAGLDAAAPSAQRGVPTVAAADNGLADRVAALEAEVGQLREALRKFAASLGESDPLS